MENFGVRLSLLRKSRGYKQKDISEAINKSRSSYAGWEAGNRYPSFEELISLSKVFDVSTDYLLGLTDVPKKVMEVQNLAEFLKQEDVNWDGMPLDSTDLRPTVLFYEALIHERKKNQNIIQFINKQAGE